MFHRKQRNPFPGTEAVTSSKTNSSAPTSNEKHPRSFSPLRVNRSCESSHQQRNQRKSDPLSKPNLAVLSCPEAESNSNASSGSGLFHRHTSPVCPETLKAASQLKVEPRDFSAGIKDSSNYKISKSSSPTPSLSRGFHSNNNESPHRSPARSSPADSPSSSNSSPSSLSSIFRRKKSPTENNYRTSLPPEAVNSLKDEPPEGIVCGNNSGLAHVSPPIFKKLKLPHKSDHLGTANANGSDKSSRTPSPNPLNRNHLWNVASNGGSNAVVAPPTAVAQDDSGPKPVNRMKTSSILPLLLLNTDPIVGSLSDSSDSSVMPAARRKIVSRSESLRERAQRKHHREKRKHSDPNLPPSHSSDADLEGRFSCNSGSSSNSSLSTRSLESPSPLDNVSSRVSGSGLSGLSSDLSSAPSNFTNTSSTVTSTANSAITSSTGGGTCFQAWDSDIEADPDPPDWTKSLDKDLLEPMTAKEKQRQEVINELFHTERSHVRNLKVLERVFFRPLADNGLMNPGEIFSLLFANLPDVLEIHARFNALMKARKREQPVVQQVGDILLEMFDGPAGDSFQRAAAQFCQNQSVALEALKERRKKDSKLQAFLSEAEGNPVCRRLQLKDMIPSVMQRLTKYPLLLESLAKYTPPRSEELTAVRKALERSKEILNQVNQAVKEAENVARLTEIQRRLDRSSFDKLEGNSEHRNFEFTKQRLLYEGALVWRNKGQKNIDVHMVLLEEYIVLLQKQDDKYILKPHSITCSMGKEESKQVYSPILKIQNVLVRQVATDKLAFFLVNTSNAGAQMMELVASSMAEKKGWFRHIIDAGEAHAARTKRGEQLAPPTHPILPPEPEKKDDELLDAQDNVSSDSGVGLTPSTETPAPSNNADTPPVVSNSVAENTSSANPESQAQAQAEAVKKAASASQPASPSQSSSPAPQRRFQRVEILKIAEGTPLIEPSEVVVSQGAVLTAEPVLTPLEKLRRKDQLIRTALCDKQRLVADILHVPQHEFEAIAEMAGEAEGEKEARELVLAAILQASRLSTVLNESLRLTEEEAIAAVSEPSPCIPSSTSPRLSRKISRLPGVPAHKLVNISSSINKHLTQLLGIITQRDEERDQLRREVQRYRDLMPPPQPAVPVSLSSASSQTQSRPHSFISTLSAEEDTPVPPALVTSDAVIEPQVNGEVPATEENGREEGLESSKTLAECINTEVITVIETPLTSLADQENTIVIPEDADTAKSEVSVAQTSEA